MEKPRVEIDYFQITVKAVGGRFLAIFSGHRAPMLKKKSVNLPRVMMNRMYSS